LKRGLIFRSAILIDPPFNFVPQSEPVQSQNAYVGNAILRHQAANHFTQKLRRLAGGNVFVLDVPIKPGD
jgi:hypothetical protein